MMDAELIRRIKEIKEEGRYTLHDISGKLDIQVSTLERWLRTGRINKIYAKMVREKLGIK